MPPTTSPRILDEQLRGGDPIAFNRVSQGLAQNIGQSVPQSSGNFGAALMGLLKQYQQLGTKPFVEQELSARQAQAQRIAAPTPPELIGAHPSLQAGVRSAAAGALQPTISGAQQSQQTFGEQIRSFGNVLDISRNIIKDFETTEAKKRDDARLAINNALTVVGGAAFEGLDPQEVSRLEQISGYPKGYLTGITKTLKERDIELKKQQQAEKGFELSPGQTRFGFNPATGKFDEVARVPKEAEHSAIYKEWQDAVRSGYTGGFIQYQAAGIARGTTGATYETRLKEEIGNIYAGRYGTQGAREKGISILKSEFPKTDVAKDIYNRVPDGYERNMKRQTASTIDQETMNSLLSDIKQGATLQQLYNAYSEISPSLIQSMYYNQ